MHLPLFISVKSPQFFQIMIPNEFPENSCAIRFHFRRNYFLSNHSFRQTPVRVSLADLQLAPSAFEVPREAPLNDSDQSSLSPKTSSGAPTFSPRDIAEIWLSNENTTRKTHVVSPDEPAIKSEEQNRTQPQSPGAWWPGRVLNVQGGFAHVEVSL